MIHEDSSSLMNSTTAYATGLLWHSKFTSIHSHTNFKFIVTNSSCALYNTILIFFRLTDDSRRPYILPLSFINHQTPDLTAHPAVGWLSKV